MNEIVVALGQAIAKRQHKDFASPQLFLEVDSIQSFVSTCDKQKINQIVSIDLVHNIGLIIITDGAHRHVISYFTSLLKKRAGHFHDVCAQSISSVGCAVSVVDYLRSLRIEACVFFTPATLNYTARFAEPFEIASKGKIRFYLALFIDDRAFRYHAIGFDIFLEYMKAIKPDFLSLQPRTVE